MNITTRRTTDHLEARDTDEEPLVFRASGTLPDAGDSVTVTSANGDIFIGEVVDVEEFGKYYVTLR